jgi:hypothetical protein
MIAKEKAKELVGKFFNQVEDVSNYKELQKQCALIAVEEILEATVKTRIKQAFTFSTGEKLTKNEYSAYWLQVKEEIAKL